MGKNKIYLDDYTEMTGKIIEVYMHDLFHELRKKGGCDGTIEITKNTIAMLPAYGPGSKGIAALKLHQYDCDCMALFLLTGCLRVHYPQSQFQWMELFDPFCESYKNENPELKMCMEELMKP